MNPPVEIRHVAMLASAGSGKTYNLALRYLRLLALEAPPESIVALTFSHKASCEMLDRIMQMLCHAGMDADKAATLSDQLAAGRSLDEHDFQGLLRRLIQALHRIRVSTLDSFAIHIVKAFPFELGVSPGFGVDAESGPEALALQQEVLLDLFDPSRLDAEKRALFIEQFKVANLGRESKGLSKLLDDYIRSFLADYRLLATEPWGDIAQLWPDHWAMKKPSNLADVVAELETMDWPTNWQARAHKAYDDFLELLKTWRPGAELKGSVFKNLIAFVGTLELRDGAWEGTLTNYSKSVIRGPLAERLRDLAGAIIQELLMASAQSTAALYTVLSLYAHHRDQLARLRAFYTFSEIQTLLSPRCHEGHTLQTGDPVEGRLALDYRLDGRFDHWLLDEFQDTSDLQWSIFANVIDEVVQDPEGRRSFFLVGDIKQSIYSWRGGNPRLFGEILDLYGSRIDRIPLNFSYRSGPAIIDTINRVFGGPQDDVLHPEAARRWQACWEQHLCSPQTESLRDFVGILHTPPDDPAADDDALDIQSTHRVLAELIMDLNPVARGLSAVVLTRTNREAHEIAKALRFLAPDIAVSEEGRGALCDDPLVWLLRSVCCYLSHPGDRLALEHILMSPFLQVLEQSKDKHLTSRELVKRWPVTFLKLAERNGIHGVLQHLIDMLSDVCSWTSFTRGRITEVLHAASLFDQAGDPDFDRFVDYLDNISTSRSSSGASVKIMNIHQSKGLGFDLVFLPLTGKRVTMAGSKQRGDARLLVEQPGKVLIQPSSQVCETDAWLTAKSEELLAHDSFEMMCVMYVAMTRAKRGLYLLFEEPPPKSPAAKTVTPMWFLESRLVDPAKKHAAPYAGSTWAYQQGHPDWYTREALLPTAPREATPAERFAAERHFKNRVSTRQKFDRKTPSGSAHQQCNAGELLRWGSSGRGIGSIVHELFAQVDWLGSESLESLRETPISRGLREMPHFEKAWSVFQEACATPAFQKRLARPVMSVELWREQSFEIISGNDWLTGTFDRVELYGAGNSRHARIVDYKTDHAETESDIQILVDRYRPQLALYVRALTILTGLPGEKIECGLLLTACGSFVPVGI